MIRSNGSDPTEVRGSTARVTWPAALVREGESMQETQGLGLRVLITAAVATVAGTGGLRGATVPIPNASFESPAMRVAPYATTRIDNWQKAPAPGWWTQQGLSEDDWLNTAGVFWNVPGSTRIDNLDGQQAVFLFSTPGVELYQDLAATYEVGQSYQLIGAFQGGGQGMPLDTPLELRLYYRDGNGDRVTIGSVEVLNTTVESLPHDRHLEDWQLETDAVSPGDAWAGRSIGVQIVSTAPFRPEVGYWRIDNVRLTSVPEPASALLLGVALAVIARSRSRG